MKSCLLITTFNRGHLLKNSLDRLSELTLPDEILIIDDGSVDNTKDICDLYLTKLPIRYIYNHNCEWSICSYARNIGIKNTDCDIIITSEPEIWFISDIVKELLTLNQQVPNQTINVGTVYHQKHKQSLVDYKKFDVTKGWIAPYCALYERKWLLDVGGWDESYIKWGHEDTDLLTRLSWSGIHQHRVLDLEVIHQWHEKLPPNIQWKSVQHNESILKSKKIETDIVANQNKEWGKIQTK